MYDEHDSVEEKKSPVPHIKLNMPILRANYVKESRSMELAMFRNVYNQNENLYNPRALTYIV